MDQNKQDIRWIQRFDNYRKALAKLSVAVNMLESATELGEEIDDLLKEGLIQRFEYTHELAWKVMKDYAEYQGISAIKGSRDAIRHALQMELIRDRVWMDTIEARNLTSHNYDEDTVQGVYDSIMNQYHKLFLDFEWVMMEIREKGDE